MVHRRLIGSLRKNLSIMNTAVKIHPRYFVSTSRTIRTVEARMIVSGYPRVPKEVPNHFIVCF